MLRVGNGAREGPSTGQVFSLFVLVTVAACPWFSVGQSQHVEERRAGHSQEGVKGGRLREALAPAFRGQCSLF